MVKIDCTSNKGFRLLSIYENLNKGEVISKMRLVEKFNVAKKTIQRDIDDLRAYLADTHSTEGEILIPYDRTRGGYFLVRNEREWLTNEEVLAICKILLASRALCKEELDVLLSKLLMQVTTDDRVQVETLLRNERFHYTTLEHNKKILSILWELSQHITHMEIICFSYRRKDGVQRKYKVNPVAILFSKHYFYLIGFIEDSTKDYPIAFRVDQIKELCKTGKKFQLPYQDRFNNDEFSQADTVYVFGADSECDS